MKQNQKEKKFPNLFENPLLNPNILGCVMSLLDSIEKRNKIFDKKMIVMLLLNIIAFYAGDYKVKIALKKKKYVKFYLKIFKTIIN